MTKKRFLAAGLVVLAAFGAFFQLAPVMHLSGLRSEITTSQPKVSRFLNFDSLSRRILAGLAIPTDSGFAIGGTEFIRGKIYQNGLDLTMKEGGRRFDSRLLAFPAGIDVVRLNWDIGQTPGKKENISRVRRNRIEKSMREILSAFGTFVGNPDSLYGFHITETPTSGDPVVLSTRRTFPERPGTDQIYGLLDTIVRFAGSGSIRRNAVPMMNISRDSGLYRLMVAWPVDQLGNNSADIFYKRMVQHLFLKTEVLGGENRTEEAIRAMDIYMKENGLNPVALPFSYLVTDRRKETDSTKWKTIVYYPCYR